MTTGAWIPEQNISANDLPDLSFWRDVLSVCGNMAEHSPDLATLLDEDQQTQATAAFNASLETWQQHIGDCDDEELLQLLRLFVLLEAQLDSCNGGAKSPAIATARILRKRKKSLDKNLLTWIRANSDNRFLPYGPL